MKFRAWGMAPVGRSINIKCLHNIQPKVKTWPRPWSPDHHCSRVDNCGDCLQRLCSGWCPRHSGIRGPVPTPSHSRFLNFPHHLHWYPHSPSRSLPLCQLPSGFCMFYLTSNTHLSFSFLLLIVSLPVSFSLSVFLFLCLLIMKQTLKAPSSHRKLRVWADLNVLLPKWDRTVDALMPCLPFQRASERIYRDHVVIWNVVQPYANKEILTLKWSKLDWHSQIIIFFNKRVLLPILA